MARSSGELPPPVDRLDLASPAPSVADGSGMSGPIVITLTIDHEQDSVLLQSEGCDAAEALEYMGGFLDAMDDEEGDAEWETIN